MGQRAQVWYIPLMNEPFLSSTSRWWSLLVFAAATTANSASASVVSRLGDIYFYDPLTFDAGILQRGANVRGGVGTRGGLLITGIDLPFYRDFSVRLGTVQRLHLDESDDLELTWRLRMPILETARFGYLSSVQVNYAGIHAFADADPLSPAHELTVAYSVAHARADLANTRHGQIGVVFRDPAGDVESLTLGRTGLVLRVAHIVQLYRPPRGLSGMWTVTFSAAELNWIHYGVSVQRGGDGRLDLTVAAPAVHFTHGHATYSLGFSPLLSLSYGPDGKQAAWGGLAGFSIFYRHQLE